MSLKTKKFIKSIEDRLAEHVQVYLGKQLGKEVAVKMDWDSYGDIEEPEDFMKRGIQTSIVEGNFARIADDEMAKEALQEAVDEVVIKNTDSEDAAEMGYSLEGKTLIFTANQKKRVFPRSKLMKKALENLL